jgi:hypothetical protein
MINLPITVVSPITREKYIVPVNNNRFLIPVPTKRNWDIYIIDIMELQSIITKLSSNAKVELGDWYAQIEQNGTFLRKY